MAKSVVIVDDIDQSSNAQTVTFAFDGQHYEIDLSKRNRQALEKALKPYIQAGRRASGTVRASRPRRAPAQKHDLAAIRAWAREQGHEVSDRGRIPQSVIQEYQAAH